VVSLQEFIFLRRGKLMALRWEDIDLAASVMRIERSRLEQLGRVARLTRSIFGPLR
jgi:integrase